MTPAFIKTDIKMESHTDTKKKIDTKTKVRYNMKKINMTLKKVTKIPMQSSAPGPAGPIRQKFLPQTVLQDTALFQAVHIQNVPFPTVIVFSQTMNIAIAPIVPI